MEEEQIRETKPASSPGDNNDIKVTPVRSVETRSKQVRNLVAYYKIDKKVLLMICTNSGNKCFCRWLLDAGKEYPKDGTPKHPEVRFGRHRKTGCHCRCIRDYVRVFHQTKDFTGIHQRLSTASKMASIAMLIGGALVNTLAFTGSSYTGCPKTNFNCLI